MSYPSEKSGKTIEDAMKAADACAARPANKKALGPMFGWALEILASEVATLRDQLVAMTKERDTALDECRQMQERLQRVVDGAKAEEAALKERAEKYETYSRELLEAAQLHAHADVLRDRAVTLLRAAIAKADG